MTEQELKQKLEQANKDKESIETNIRELEKQLPQKGFEVGGFVAIRRENQRGNLKDFPYFLAVNTTLEEVRVYDNWYETGKSKSSNVDIFNSYEIKEIIKNLEELINE